MLPMNAERIAAALRAGHGATIIANLQAAGIVFDSRLGSVDFIHPDALTRPDLANPFGLACDAQPELVTVSNAGIPAFLANFLDPKFIEVLVTPMKAAQIAGETQKGNWLTATAMFPVIESTGETSAYGDYNGNGSTGVNVNWPQAQSFHYQTVTQYGERELAEAGLAKIDWAGRLNIASALVLNKYQNQTYFYGVSGLQNYGLLNNPAMYPSIAPAAAWNLSSTTAESVYDDVRRLVLQAITQANGTIDASASMKLVCSPPVAVAFNKTNQYNVNVMDQLRKNFPSMTFDTAPEYSTAAGELVQLIVEGGDGQATVSAAYTEKMRAHTVVADMSAWKQKKSQGTWGSILFRPYLIASMLGV